MALLALVAVTAVWGVTFVPVKHAVALYPLFAFMTVRFAVATATLAIPAAPRLRLLGAPGLRAGAVLGGLLATGYALQTAGLQRTDVSSTGFITGLYVVLTPLFALVLFRSRIGVAVWLGVVCSVGGLALLAGVHAAGTMGDLLVLASTAAQALQIVFAERYAAQYDALALTFVEMLVALGAAADERCAHRAPVRARVSLRGTLRLPARPRPARRRRLVRLRPDHGGDRRRGARRRGSPRASRPPAADRVR